jgi:uncharacterized delta-60 repeat protein
MNASGKKVFAIARYNSSNGALDTGFDTDGKQTANVGTEDAVAYSVTIQPDGKILAGGYAVITGPVHTDFALVRFNNNGSLDTDFDTDGKLTTGITSGMDDVIYSVALQSDNKILVAGSTNTTSTPPASRDFVIARYTPSGALDISGPNPFTGAGPGYTIIDFGSSDDIAYSLASQGTNIIVGGTVGASLGLARLINGSGILPVSIASFSATKKQGSVEVNWQTAGELNIASYEVQRSSDGRNFITVGKLQASASSLSGKYSFTDSKPLKAVSFYRLKIVHVDQSLTYSRIVAITMNSASVGLQSFPNPVSTTVNLQFTLPEGEVILQLIDVSGRLLKKEQLWSDGNTMSTSLDMSGQKKGLYMLRINQHTLKLVKE